MALSRTFGTVASVQRCPGHRQPMEPLAEATLIANVGIAGDRHAGAGKRRQVLLVESETLDEFGLAPGEIKENVTTLGFNLMSQPDGTLLQIGSTVRLELTGECEPCGRLDEILPGLQDMLAHRRGMLALVIAGGNVHPGDRITLVEST
jgi:MOSC domain-containing protein YiiM